MTDGRYEFRRITGSSTPWSFGIGELLVYDDRTRIAPGANQEVELTIRDGEFFSELTSIAGGDMSSGTVLVTNGSVRSFNGLELAIGSGAEALLRLTDSTLSVGDDITIGPGGSLEVLGNSTATASILSQGDVRVEGDASSGFQARLEGNELASSRLDVNNLGVVEADLTLSAGTLTLRSGGRVEVPADGLGFGMFNWVGGTLALKSDFRIDSDTDNENPLGASVSVAPGRTLEVQGTSVIHDNGQLEVGTQNQGSLTISGGTVTSATARIGTSGLPTGPAAVALLGSTGTMTVAGNLTIGGLPNLQTATINVSGGADLSVGDALVATPGLRADVTVDGAGSTFVSANSVYLGGNASSSGGQGTLALANGALLDVGDSAGDVLSLWNGYAVTMNQSAINARNLTVRGSIAPAAGAIIPGHVTVAGGTSISGGSLTLSPLSSNVVASGNVVVQAGGTLNAYIHGGGGTNVTVSDAGSTWTTPNVVGTVLGSTTSAVGRIRSLTLNPGATANLAGGVSYAAGAIDGLTLAGGTLNAPSFNGGTVGVGGNGVVNASYSGSGTIVANGPLTIGSATSTIGFTTTGQISAFAHPLTLNDANAAELGSLTTIGFVSTPGSLTAANGLALGAGETLAGFGTVNTSNNSARALVNNGAINGSSTSDRLTLTGYVTGTGSNSNVEFAGTYAPGAGVASVSGTNIKFTNTSQLIMGIGGPTPGLDHDKITDAGQLIVDGRLTVEFINIFLPTVGQTFDLFDFASLAGTFDVLDLPLMPGLRWDTSQLYTQGRLSVATLAFLQADFEEDHDVDAADLVRWTSGFGQFESGGAAHDEGDATGEGVVDGTDFLVWQRQLGLTTVVPATTGVPEPASMVIAVLACAAIGCLVRGR